MSHQPENADQWLRHSVEQARTIGARVFGDEGISAQIIEGDWAGKFSGAVARDLSSMWDSLAEHIRFVRAVTGGETEETNEPSREWLTGLPLNRKERYYTGTVLPGLVGSDGFAHLDRFLQLCGLDVAPPVGLDGPRDLLFVTEYGFAESVFTEADRERWGTDVEADTPDIVIAGPNWLLAIEAKMFHAPNASALNAQMERQSKVLARWVDVLGFSEESVAHVLLLPDKLATATAGLKWPVVTWEQILERYRLVGPRYWLNVLATALADYDELVSVGPSFGQYADGRMTGAQIVDVHAEGEDAFTTVGRSGGLSGSAFAQDIETGQWRSRSYEVRHHGLPNDNWFTIADFVAATAKA